MPLAIGIGIGTSIEGVGASDPVTTNFSSATIATALAGPVDTTTNTARRTLRAATTTWLGRIRGTEALLTVASHANTANVILVSVDGSAFTALTTASNIATLFTGLTDDWHTVAFRPGTAFGNTVYLAATGDILAVTGASPAIDVPTNMVQVGVSGDFTASGLSALSSPVNHVPASYYTDFSINTGRSLGSISGRGAPTKLWIATKATYVAVSVDGAAPSYYAGGTQGGVLVTCDGATHDYHVWDSGFASGTLGTLLSLGSDAAWSDLSVERRLHHFGHSIAAGQAGTSRAHTDMARTAARNGYLFNNLAWDGRTIATLESTLTTVLAPLTVTSADVAVVDIGRNDGTGALSGGNQTSLTNVINALLTKGYGTVLVLGQMVQTSYDPDAGGLNGSISSLVSGLGNPAVIFVSRSAYTGVATSDGTHPTDAGYVTMDGFNVTSIDPLI